MTPGDKYLFWAISGACQLRCRYCFYATGSNRLPPGWVDAETGKALIPKLGTIFRRIIFTGGEPLLNPAFGDLVATARDFGMETHFLTDGIRLDAACARQVRQHGLSRLYISLDSLSPGINESLRLPPQSLRGFTNQVIRNIEALLPDRPPQLEIVILQTVCKGNIDSIEPMVAFCRRLGLDLLVHPAGFSTPVPDTSDIRLDSCSEDELQRLERAMQRWAQGHAGREKYTKLALTILRGLPLPSGVSCPMGTRSFFLDVDGTLSPCFHRTDIRLGNAYKDDPHEILTRPFPDLRTAPCANLACACMLE